MTVDLLLVLKLTILFIFLYSILFIFLKRVFEGSGTLGLVCCVCKHNTVVEILDVVILSYHLTFSIKT